jgi:hypothetical protein
MIVSDLPAFAAINVQHTIARATTTFTVAHAACAAMPVVTFEGNLPTDLTGETGVEVPHSQHIRISGQSDDVDCLICTNNRTCLGRTGNLIRTQCNVRWLQVYDGR